MRLRYLSDLHLEFITPNKIDKLIYKIKPNTDDFTTPSCGAAPQNFEICILAGDIGNPYGSNYDKFMKHINKTFKKSFVIAGNHEYYSKKSMNDINDYLDHYFKQFDNIRFLNNDFEIYENHCFIGTTLWSKITNPNYEINDVYNITDFRNFAESKT